jgi:hypothetical protein
VFALSASVYPSQCKLGFGLASGILWLSVFLWSIKGWRSVKE